MVAVLVLIAIGEKGGSKGEEVVYVASPSKLGNYSDWAVATDAAACVTASRWMYGLGGNAIDAAVATMLCHTLALPQSSGIGGGFVATVYFA
ncbi:hypothetical protein HPB49_011595 [Dermacentor silvarum]|uniref:Uncharacterized protein n=1 Tax=Dermacentor silvarum TaxID=543639 RepID=A0ACB8D561_DERSI|nr:hypothetical protein HPB49_011595 [Dermacentor silvarum]